MRFHLACGLALLACLGCGSSSDVTDPAGGNAAESGETGDPGAADASGDSGGKQVQLPSDPFFTDYAYPGAVADDDTVTMGNATSVWFKTNDDMAQVADFFNRKFAGGNNLVEDERAYFAKTSPDGTGYGATVTKQNDGSIQIILKLERP